jgi:hypothetical protein
MIRVIVWMAMYDLRCDLNLSRLLLWCEEFLSLSQANVERALCVLYAIGVEIPTLSERRAAGTVAAVLFLLPIYLVWRMHRTPVARRGGLHKHPIRRLGRVLVQFCFLGLTVLIVAEPPHRWEDGFFAAAQLAYVVHLYVTDLKIDGERGRRRKLAWDKLKALFGPLEWIPRPVQVER